MGKIRFFKGVKIRFFKKRGVNSKKGNVLALFLGNNFENFQKMPKKIHLFTNFLPKKELFLDRVGYRTPCIYNLLYIFRNIVLVTWRKNTIGCNTDLLVEGNGYKRLTSLRKIPSKAHSNIRILLMD